jgi:molybdopterin-containing oxidoreductase family iron-sulfur binding subunit
MSELKSMPENAPNSAKPNSPQRRRFIGAATATAAGLTIAPGAMLYTVAHGRSEGLPASSAVRWGMLVDATQCATGCDDCVTACSTENGWTPVAESQHPRQAPQWIRKLQLQDPLTQMETNLPMMCQHCDEAPCVDVCPTGASFKRADGIVLVNRHTCIGCRYCMMACPYKARSLVHEPLNDTQKTDVPRGIGCVEACTLCVQKIDRGDGNTACAEACTAAGHSALLFGDMNDPESEISKRLRELPTKQVRADLNLNLGVRYHGI